MAATKTPAQKPAAPPVEDVVEADTDTTLEQPPPPTHNPKIVRMARTLGFSAEQIDAMTPDDLLDSIAEENAARAGERRVQTAPAPEKKEPPPPEVDELEAGAESFRELNPELADYLKKLGKSIKEAKAIGKRIDDAEGRELTRHQRTNAEKIDAAFDSLGDDYAAIFGTGSVLDGSLDPTSAESKRRAAIFREAGIDFANLPGPATLKRKLLDAAKTFFPTAAKPAKPAGATIYEDGAAGDESVLAEPEPAPPRGPDGKFTKEEWADGGLRRPAARVARDDDQPLTLDDSRKRFLKLEKSAGR